MLRSSHDIWGASLFMKKGPEGTEEGIPRLAVALGRSSGSGPSGGTKVQACLEVTRRHARDQPM